MPISINRGENEENVCSEFARIYMAGAIAQSVSCKISLSARFGGFLGVINLTTLNTLNAASYFIETECEQKYVIETISTSEFLIFTKSYFDRIAFVVLYREKSPSMNSTMAPPVVVERISSHARDLCDVLWQSINLFVGPHVLLASLSSSSVASSLLSDLHAVIECAINECDRAISEPPVGPPLAAISQEPALATLLQRHLDANRSSLHAFFGALYVVLDAIVPSEPLSARIRSVCTSLDSAHPIANHLTTPAENPVGASGKSRAHHLLQALANVALVEGASGATHSLVPLFLDESVSGQDPCTLAIYRLCPGVLLCVLFDPTNNAHTDRSELLVAEFWEGVAPSLRTLPALAN